MGRFQSLYFSGSGIESFLQHLTFYWSLSLENLQPSSYAQKVFLLLWFFFHQTLSTLTEISGLAAWEDFIKISYEEAVLYLFVLSSSKQSYCSRFRCSVLEASHDRFQGLIAAFMPLLAALTLNSSLKLDGCQRSFC